MENKETQNNKPEQAQTQTQKDRRPSITEENKTYKKTIKALQNENTTLSEKNHELDKENLVLKHKLSNFGLRDLLKNLGFLIGGVSYGNYQNKQFETAAQSAFVALLLLMVFSIYDIFTSRNKKENS